MKQKAYILHGWAIDQENEKKWDVFRSELQARGIETIFLPIPGLSTPLSEVWTLNDYVSWLESELTDKKEVILLGHSFGGQIASRYTAQHPDQVGKLILIDSAGIIDKSTKKVIKRAVFGFIAKLGKKVFQHELLRVFLYKLAREQDYLKANSIQRQTMANVISDEIISDLKKIPVPTLIIWGKDDSATPLKHGKQMHQLLQDSTLKIISGARHAPQFTHATETAQLVGEFLR